MTLWHELLAIVLLDLFEGTIYELETEHDLSKHKQQLDILVLRRGQGVFDRELPDRFATLAPHNLLTFKSQHESLTPWVLSELLGHYVNYRKQSSPSLKQLLPEDDYQLFAVSAKNPEDLRNRFPLQPVQQGVYECLWGEKWIRIIVISELPYTPANARLNLFSSVLKQRESAAHLYQPYSTHHSTRVEEFLRSLTGETMPKTLAEQIELFIEHTLDMATPEQRLRGLPHQELLNVLTPEERLRGVPPTELLNALSPEQLDALVKTLGERANKKQA